MKKVFSLVFISLLLLCLSGCSILELIKDDDDIVDLGSGETIAKWNLVWNNNEYRPVETAYFEFDNTNFKYYENGELKKEGSHRITYFGVENTISPLHLNLNFGLDSTRFSIYDYIYCYTEDSKDNLHQFTIISEGYHIKPLRSGGVPVRDYHLSDMPYAFGTYVKEGTEQYEYKNGKVNYLNCAKLDGTFIDEFGNKLYFANNSYSSNNDSNVYSSYTIYMRYENNQKNITLEGTIKLSWYEDFYTKEHYDVALIYVMHGESEPGEESGTSVEADYELFKFVFTDENDIQFESAKYFSEKKECEFDPIDFVGGLYHKVD